MENLIISSSHPRLSDVLSLVNKQESFLRDFVLSISLDISPQTFDALLGSVAQLNSIKRLFEDDTLSVIFHNQKDNSFWIRKADLPQSFEELSLEMICKSITDRGKKIKKMPKAPKPLALFFPQYHPIPQNDYFWGEGFTEWTLLKPCTIKGIRKPLSWEEGGLGYYHLLDYEVRKRQAEIAKRAGVYGFVYYHYWFTGEGAPADHKVMYKPLEKMLEDGQPDLPFAISWANEVWEVRWDKKPAHPVKISQTYGNPKEWEEHFYFLLKFFRHPKYICVDGKPMIIIYRPGHMKSMFQPMMALWKHLAVENGLKGLHLITTHGYHYRCDRQFEIENPELVDATFHFWPSTLRYEKSFIGLAGSVSDITFTPVKKQYWGTYTGFDKRPRQASFRPELISPKKFQMSLQKTFKEMANSDSDEKENFLFITSWNEWNEQCLLEPDSTLGFAYCDALFCELSKYGSSV